MIQKKLCTHIVTLRCVRITFVVVAGQYVLRTLYAFCFLPSTRQPLHKSLPPSIPFAKVHWNKEALILKFYLLHAASSIFTRAELPSTFYFREHNMRANRNKYFAGATDISRRELLDVRKRPFYELLITQMPSIKHVLMSLSSTSLMNVKNPLHAEKRVFSSTHFHLF
jgi:hypothetical protein